MAFSGPWEREGSKQIYDFDEKSKKVTILSDASDESSAAVTAAFVVDEKAKTLSLTADGKVNLYDITGRNDTKISLRRKVAPNDDSMEEEVIVLVPAGYPGGVVPDDAEEDGNDSGVDMGMDLCIVGKKISK